MFFYFKKKELIATLESLKPSMYSNISIISISNLKNELDAENFLKLFLCEGYYVNSISPLFINTLNGLVAYTKILFTKKKTYKEYNLNYYFKRLRKKISIVNLFNLN